MKRFLKWHFSKKDTNEQKEYCKYIVIPDLHGTHSIFQKVDGYIKENCEENRKIIFLGDYLDRGEPGAVYGKEFYDAGSYHTLKGLLSLKNWAKKENRTLYFLRGNHEIFFEDYFLKERQKPYDKYPFFRESVDALEFAFQNDHSLFSKFEIFLDELIPYYLDKENGYLFIHAGVDFSVGSLKEQAKNGLIYWIREKFIYSTKKLPYTVIFGHTPFEKPFIKSDRIGLDSGIYNSGFINLLKIDGGSSRIVRL